MLYKKKEDCYLSSREEMLDISQNQLYKIYSLLSGVPARTVNVDSMGLIHLKSIKL